MPHDVTRKPECKDVRSRADPLKELGTLPTSNSKYVDACAVVTPSVRGVSATYSATSKYSSCTPGKGRSAPARPAHRPANTHNRSNSLAQTRRQRRRVGRDVHAIVRPDERLRYNGCKGASSSVLAPRETVRGRQHAPPLPLTQCTVTLPVAGSTRNCKQGPEKKSGYIETLQTVQATENVRSSSVRIRWRRRRTRTRRQGFPPELEFSIQSRGSSDRGPLSGSVVEDVLWTLVMPSITAVETLENG